jgi:hypothetical protein
MRRFLQSWVRGERIRGSAFSIEKDRVVGIQESRMAGMGVLLFLVQGVGQASR